MSVFGALNRFISRLDADPIAPPQSESAFGFQVLRNVDLEIPIEPWFDFIIGINGHNIDNADPNLFATEVRNCAGTSIELGLWSAKGARIRSVWVSVPTESPSLGLSLQWHPISAAEDVWHILDVATNSPADVAGLLPYGDYIIGSPEGLLKGEAGLGELVEDYIEQSLRLYVYNHEYNVTRLVTIEPSRTWGGNGALGCTLGFGALHRIPAPLNEPPQGPGETLFETARLSSEVPGRTSYSGEAPPRSEAGTPQYLVPAELTIAPKSPISEAQSPAAGPPPLGSGRKKRAQPHGARGVELDMDAYFQEGEAKSREQELAPSAKPNPSLAPPPKAGKPGSDKADETEETGGEEQN